MICRELLLLSSAIALIGISLGQIYDEEGENLARVVLQYRYRGPLKSVRLKDKRTGQQVGDIGAHIVDDHLMIDISAMQDNLTQCVLKEDVHIRANLLEYDKEVYSFHKEGGSTAAYFYAVGMREIWNYCEQLKAGKVQTTNDLYTVSGNVDVQCQIIEAKGVRNLNKERSASYEIGVDCGIPRAQACYEVDIAACPWRDTECVTDSLWDKKPLPYIPEDDDWRAVPIRYNDRSLKKHRVAYVAAYSAVDKPFVEDKHRALILTQPKVGTGALWEAMLPVSDFLVRSHEVDILHPNALWVPFPGCTAKPANGDCTVVMAFRDPKTWLVSSYFELQSATLCNKSILDDAKAVQSYYKFLRIPRWRGQILRWWSIGRQLRELGIENSTSFIQKVMENDGVQMIKLHDLPSAPYWMRECNLVVLQTEMAKFGTKAERTFRSILPKFRFQRPEDRVERVDLCPQAGRAYNAIKNAEIPEEILNAYLEESHDFRDAWELYHPSQGTKEHPVKYSQAGIFGDFSKI